MPLWTEKYRPSKAEDLILPDRIKSKLGDGFQNMLLYGNPGLGKTSFAKLIAKDRPHLFINCSIDSGIDSIREMIIDFCSTSSVLETNDSIKVVILDEIEGVSDAYFKALRGIMEQFHGNVRFVATTNYISKIPDPIVSRFDCIDFDPTEPETKDLKMAFLRRVAEIIKSESVKIEKEAAVEIVKRNFPDLRRMISMLQSLSNLGKEMITLADVEGFKGENEKLFEIAIGKADPIENYKYVAANCQGRVDSCIDSFGREFIEYIGDKRPEIRGKLLEIVYEVNSHSFQSRFAIDPMITLLSLVFKIQTIVAKIDAK